MKVKDDPRCAGCPMARLFPENNVVPPKYGTGLRLTIGAAPSADDAKAGEPFVGGYGRILDMLLARARIRKQELTLTNVLACRPPDNIFPTSPKAKYISKNEGFKAVHQCMRNHVLPVLEARPWQRIDLIGEIPLRYVGLRKEGIFKWRGSPIAIDLDELKQTYGE